MEGRDGSGRCKESCFAVRLRQIGEAPTNKCEWGEVLGPFKSEELVGVSGSHLSWAQAPFLPSFNQKLQVALLGSPPSQQDA